jgi:hypothetical protein
VSDSLGNVGVEVFGFALGDHGIFCRRHAFWKAGEFPELPLMEDAEFYRSLRRCGRMRQLRTAIVGSQRRYEQLGPYRTTIYYAIVLGLYRRARMSTHLGLPGLNRDVYATKQVTRPVCRDLVLQTFFAFDHCSVGVAPVVALFSKASGRVRHRILRLGIAGMPITISDCGMSDLAVW